MTSKKDKMDIAKKIKDQRIKKGFSQQELADAAEISSRTVQRIENGQTQPQGFTLRSICEALGLPPEDLFDEHLVENTGMVQALHLSIISGNFIPAGNILVPAILWLANKNKFVEFDHQAKNILVFQTIIQFLGSFWVLRFFWSIIDASKLDVTIIDSFMDNFYFIPNLIKPAILVAYPVICTLIIQYKGVKNFYPNIFKK